VTGRGVGGVRVGGGDRVLGWLLEQAETRPLAQEGLNGSLWVGGVPLVWRHGSIVIEKGSGKNFTGEENL